MLNASQNAKAESNITASSTNSTVIDTLHQVLGIVDKLDNLNSGQTPNVVEVLDRLDLKVEKLTNNNEEIIKSVSDLQTEVNSLLNNAPIQTIGAASGEQEALLKLVTEQLQALSSQPHSVVASESVSSELSDLIREKLSGTHSIDVLVAAVEESNKSVSSQITDMKDKLSVVNPDSSRPPWVDECDHLIKVISEKFRELPGDTEDSTSSMQLDKDSTPNTASPAPCPEPFQLPSCEPYVRYEEDVIDNDMKELLVKFAEENTDKFKTEGDSRDTQYYGEYGYWYTGSYHKPSRIPPVLQDLLQKVRPHLSNKNAWMNSCLVTRYKDKSSGVPFHRDNEAFIDPGSEILTVSIGAKRTLTFKDNSGTIANLELADCSAYVMSRYSQDLWEHSILPEDEDTDVRYSFTYRHISPHFLNSTAIVGDSNTKHLSFGKGAGSFGKWMPGHRVKAALIEDIPDPGEIGPVRNVVIHTGINNLNSADRRRSNQFLVNLLRSKCRRFTEAYPHMKIYISLLLPTKLRSLNNRVRELNNLILEMSYGYKNINIIDNSMFLDKYECLAPEFGTYDVVLKRHNDADALHLGSSGIKMFSSHIKRCVMRKNNSQSVERFNGGRGKYNAAAMRGFRGGF